MFKNFKLHFYFPCIPSFSTFPLYSNYTYVGHLSIISQVFKVLFSFRLWWFKLDHFHCCISKLTDSFFCHFQFAIVLIFWIFFLLLYFSALEFSFVFFTVSVPPDSLSVLSLRLVSSTLLSIFIIAVWNIGLHGVLLLPRAHLRLLL